MKRFTFLILLLVVPCFTVLSHVCLSEAKATMINGTETTFTPSNSLSFAYDVNSPYDLSLEPVGVEATDGEKTYGGTVVSGISYDFTIPNFFDPLLMKTIDITITGGNDEAIGIYLPHVEDIFGFDTPYPDGGTEERVQGYFVSGTLSSTLVTELWEIYPNPDYEHVIVWAPDNFQLQSIRIETQSVLDPIPEPATIFLFGIGFLGLAGVSRQKK